MLYSLGDRLGPTVQPREGTPFVVLRRRPRDGFIEAGVRVLPVRTVHRVDGGVCEVGPDESWLYDGDLDAETFYLEAQGVAQRFDGVLGRVVIASAWERQLPAHGGDVDDSAIPLPSHSG